MSQVGHKVDTKDTFGMLNITLITSSNWRIIFGAY